MSSLRRTTIPKAGETPISFASRLATANGIGDVRDFLQDKGIAPNALLLYREEEVAKLLRMAGLEPQASQALAPRRADGLPARLRVVDGHWSRAGDRACPHCLLDDISASTLPSDGAWLRAAWQVRWLHTCPVHHVRLVRLRVLASGPAAIGGTAMRTRFAEDFDALGHGATPTPSSELEKWAYSSLQSEDGARPDSSYLDGFPVTSVVRLSQMVGAGMLRGRMFSVDGMTDEDWVEAGRLGFPLVQAGPEGLSRHLAALEDEHRSQKKPRVSPIAIYGTLYRWLARNAGPDGLSDVAALVRDRALARYPFGAQDDVFGPVGHRRWHTVATAAGEHMVSCAAVKGALARARCSPSRDGRHALFDAPSVDRIMSEASGLLTAQKARALAGATADQWNRLVSASLLRKAPGSTKGHDRFSAAEVERFVADVQQAAVVGHVSGLVPIPVAVRRSGRSFVHVIGLLRRRRLRNVTLLPGLPGIEALMVDAVEIRSAEPPDGMTILKVADIAERLGCGTAATIAWLRRVPLLVSRSDDINWRSDDIIDTATMDGFLASHLSLRDIAERSGLETASVRKALEAGGCTPVLPHSLPLLCFYLTSAARYRCRGLWPARVPAASPERQLGRCPAAGPGAMPIESAAAQKDDCFSLVS